MTPRTAALPRTPCLPLSRTPSPSHPPAWETPSPPGRTGRGPARWARGGAGGGGRGRCGRGGRARRGGHVAVGRAAERGAGGEGLPAGAGGLGRGAGRRGDARRPRHRSAVPGGLPGRRRPRLPAPVARRFAGSPARLPARRGWGAAGVPGPGSPPASRGRRSETGGGARRLGEAGPALESAGGSGG